MQGSRTYWTTGAEPLFFFLLLHMYDLWSRNEHCWGKTPLTVMGNCEYQYFHLHIIFSAITHWDFLSVFKLRVYFTKNKVWCFLRELTNISWFSCHLLNSQTFPGSWVCGCGLLDVKGTPFILLTLRIFS